MRKSLIILAVLVIILPACAPGPSPQAVQAQVETAVAQTMAAQEQIAKSVALTVAAQNPTTTSTPVFTATSSVASPFPSLTPVIPTVTPLPSSGGSGSGGGGSTVANYSCDIIHRRPFDNQEFNRGDKFDIKWTILNTGTKTWPAGFDVKYFSGPHMTTATRVELPEMKPKAQFDIVFDAVAPNERGFQVMTWVVEGQICYPYTAIIVK